jgi:subtilisin family serine protease
MAKIALTSLTLSFCLLVTLVTSAPSTSSKISPSLQTILKGKTHQLNIFVSFAQGTAEVLSKVSLQTSAFSRSDRVTALYNALNAHAAISQKNIIEFLAQPKFFATKVQSFWITNQIYVQSADASLIASLASFDEVSRIEEEQIVHLNDQPISNSECEESVLAEANIEKVKAPEAWAAGFDGTGSVIGVIDTGARVTHEALQASYRGSTHSWFNPYAQTATPADGNGHGTHVTGIVAGSQASGIGVAPGAKWIACKGLNDQGSGTQSALISCGQFMICPHTYAGQNPDCSAAPDAVSNSWGPVAAAFFQDVINAWRAAKIVPIFAQGASGFCVASSPPAGVIMVGATTADDGAATFSGGGPAGANGRITPDIVAPGQAIKSAGHTSDTAYVAFSGTSMAAPHVAGLVGILRGKNPGADFDEIYDTITSTAERNLKFSGRTCDGIPDDQFPNHSFGWGRIDCLAAVQ